MYEKQKSRSNFIKKVICAVLSFLMISTAYFPTITYAKPTTTFSVSDNRTFAEKHPALYKCLVLGAKAAIIIGAAVGTYYLGGYALDKVFPDRVTDRELEAEIEKTNREIKFNILEKLRKDSLSTEERIDCLKVLNSAKNDSKDNFKDLKRIAGIGGLITTLDIGVTLLNQSGEAARSTLNIMWVPFAFTKIGDVFGSIKNLFKAPPKFLTKKEIFSNFDKLFQSMEGQEDAKREISNFVYDNVLAKDQARWSKKKYDHGDILYFYGPSGVGKSLASSYLPYVFTPNPRVFVMTSSDIDKENKKSVVSQIFAPEFKGYSEDKPPKSKLVEFIENNPGGFVKIEEYDKLCTPALDEIFRTIADTGAINVNGEKIDCSGITFILTSNEDDVSMNGFDKNDVEKINKDAIKDGYTRVWHDKSFLNRVRKVKFNNLTSKNYEAILKKSFDDKFKYWKDAQNGGINLTIDETSIKKLANKIENIHQGARPIYLSVLPEFQSEMVKKVQTAPNLDFYKNKKLAVSYDDKLDKILINEKN